MWSHCCRSGKTGLLCTAMRDIRGATRAKTPTTMMIDIVGGTAAVKAKRPEHVGVENVTQRTSDLVVDGWRRRLCAHGTHTIRHKEIRWQGT